MPTPVWNKLYQSPRGIGLIETYSMFILRYIKFLQSLKKSPKIAVQYLYQKVKDNVETVTGRNIAYILKLSHNDDIEKINLLDLSRRIKFEAMRKEDSWKVDMIREVVNIKKNIFILDNKEDSFHEDELNDIINYLSTS